MKNNKENNPLIEELLRDIRSYERVIKRHPEDSNAHYVEAGDFVKLAQTTNDHSYYEQALKQYDQAIKLYPKNALYLVDRAKLYLTMQKFDLAAQDLDLAKKIVSTDNTENKVIDMYVANTIKEISKSLLETTELSNAPSSSSLPLEEPLHVSESTINTSPTIHESNTVISGKAIDIDTNNNH